MKRLAATICIVVAVGWFARRRKWVEVDLVQDVGDYGPIDLPIGRITRRIH